MIYNLGKIAIIKGGKRIPKGEKLQEEKNDHPYLRIADFDGRNFSQKDLKYVPDNVFPDIRNYVINVGDIFLSIVGTIGIAKIINKSLDGANLTENAVKISPTDCVDRKYLELFLQSRTGQSEIASRIVGSTHPKLPIKNIKNIEIDLPTLSEQKKIAKKIDTLDRKIDLNNQINDNLANIKTTIFNHMFDAHIKNNLNGTLQDIAEIKTGKRPNTKYDTKKENFIYHVVGASKIMGYTNKFLYDESIITTGRVGTHGIVQRYREPVWVSDNSFILRSKHEDYLFELLHNYINYDALNTGSTQPLITQSNLKNVNIFIPSKEKLTLFEQRVVPLTDQQFKIKDQNNILHELKLQLLSKYF